MPIDVKWLTVEEENDFQHLINQIEDVDDQGDLIKIRKSLARCKALINMSLEAISNQIAYYQSIDHPRFKDKLKMESLQQLKQAITAEIKGFPREK